VHRGIKSLGKKASGPPTGGNVTDRTFGTLSGGYPGAFKTSRRRTGCTRNQARDPFREDKGGKPLPGGKVKHVGREGGDAVRHQRVPAWVQAKKAKEREHFPGPWGKTNALLAGREKRGGEVYWAAPKFKCNAPLRLSARGGVGG